MSGSDYTTTPNLGLYKPNYALDVGQWGHHLNLNADKLDAAITNVGVNASDFGVSADAEDNGPALQAFLNTVAGGYKKGILPSGFLLFSTPLSVANGYGLSLEGGGPLTTILVYTGAATTPALLTVSGCVGFCLSGFAIDSQTTMTAGAGLHIHDSSQGYMRDIVVAGPGGQNHAGSGGNYYNLWNGLWFDQIDNVRMIGFAAFARNDCIRVNGAISGKKADLVLLAGKVGGGTIGLHVGGAFGGLYVDDGMITGNWNNVVIDRALTAEENREIFLGPNLACDGSGLTGTGAFVPPSGFSGVGDNILVSDASGGFLLIKGWVASAFSGGNNIHIVQWNGDISIDGATIFNAGVGGGATGDGVRIDTATPAVSISPSTSIEKSSGYGINATVARFVRGQPRFAFNTAGNVSSLTRLGLDGLTITNGASLSLLDAGGSPVQFVIGSDNHFGLYSTDASGGVVGVWDFYARTATPLQKWNIPTSFNANVGFNSGAPIAKPTVTGAKGGNAAVASLLAALAAYGLVTDSTT
jgi:hypothetical protein